jgi:hypothetical protein
MSSRRLSLLLLFALCGLACYPTGPRRSRMRVGTLAVRRTDATIPPTAWSALSRSDSFAPHTPYRYRLKSVLPDSDSRISQESDLGPLPAANGPDASMERCARAVSSRAIIPLRC